MDARQERGLAIAATTPIKRTKGGYVVPSQSGGGAYTVQMEGCQPQCTCPDFGIHGNKCKHIYAVEYTMRREEKADGTTVVTKTVKVTYKQNWPVYNEAQTHEREHFERLLHSLCEGIQQPPQRMGRPRLPMSDMVFTLISKVYSTKSARRFEGELVEAAEKGLVAKAADFSSGFRYLENPELTPLLKSLIEESALPLKAVETDFAVDSSGFSTTTYNRWFDHKWGKVRSEAKWVKAHLMCGVKTHIVTSVEVTPTETADAPQLPALVSMTAQNFSIREVSADKAYSSRRNLRAIQAVGGAAYIPFKNRTTGMGKSFDGLWNQMWHYYNFNRSAFMEHYHRRSNVETSYSMIKAKFGGSVRSKMPTAQVNEVLCKIVAHNICCLISSIYELGIEPTFSSGLVVDAKVA